MKELTFDRLLCVGIVLIILANIVAFWFHAGILVNAAWIVYGGFAIRHPVCPRRWKGSDREKNALLSIRIGGALCIAVGLLTRFVV